MLLLSIGGFADAAFLAIQHYRGGGLICGPFGDCGAVTTSRYSAFAGIPVALLGGLFYLALILLIVAYFDSGKERFLTLSAILTFPGFLVSAVFVYLQLFVLHAFCFYCMVSALFCTVLMVVGALQIYRWRSGRTA